VNFIKSRRFFVGLGVVCLLVGGIYALYRGISYFYPEEKKPDAKVVEVETVSLNDITQTVRLIGTVQAKRSATLTAKTVGTLDHIAYAGQEIRKGDLIAKLENADLEETYHLSINAEIIARNQYERIEGLAKNKVKAAKDVEDSRNQWIEAQKSLATAKIEFEKTRYIAPFDGIVGVFKIREGAQVQVGNPIVSFYDPSELIIEFDIPAPVLKQIHEDPGASSQQKDHAAIINGNMVKVAHIQRMIDPDTHMSPAYVDFSCDNCMVGSNITIDFIVVEHKGVMILPYEAIFLREGKPHVYGVKDNKTALCPVTLGIREKDRIEVTAGIKAGDPVVIRGQERLSPDLEVKVFEKKQTAS
jgi:membrane fusion protein (multidrug efflux system)